jgi:arylsulfatase
MMRSAGVRPRQHFVYWGKDIHLQMMSAPPITFLPFTLEAELEIPPGGGEGVIAAAGSHFGGWSFYLDDGRPVAFASISPLPLPGAQSRITSDRALTPGRHKLRFDFEFAGEGGVLTIAVDGESVASGKVARRPRILAGNGETFDTGRDTNVPVSPDYTAEGPFNGELTRVDVRVKMPGGAKPAAKGEKAGSH